ncbi:hypothetical protein HWV62_3328 [Athelia sp. TMB]|nr:hypothetical protein HWV62_3328 [Athelia sp. TMB]
MPNQILCLGTTGADCTTTYVVKSDDTCDTIASATGVNTTMLGHNNPQITDSCDNIYTGEVLCIAPSVVRPAPHHHSSGGSGSGSASTAAAVPTTPVTIAVPAPSASSGAKSGSGASGSLSGGNGGGEDELPWCDEL